MYDWPFLTMVDLIFIEAILGATVTYFVTQTGKYIAADTFKVFDFAWILAAQSGSYLLD